MTQNNVPPSGTNNEITTKAADARLGGRVWHDENADELLDTNERAIAGATVQLVRDLDRDGKITANEVLATTTTDASGNYGFDGLIAGDEYQVQFTAPAGYDASATNLVTDTIVLRPGEVNDTVGLGFYKYASLGDRVWNDTNQDGVQDAGEAGRAGVQVELYTAYHGTVGAFAPSAASAIESDFVMPGELVATQLTDAQGNYRFTNLQPGQYIARFVAPDGTVLSTANIGLNDAADWDADPNSGSTGVYKLASGEGNDTVDAGVSSSQDSTPVADCMVVCEDRSSTFNVLSNDLGEGLKLIKVAHESSSLDSLFRSRGGAISFTADGNVTYKTMTNYYGYDKLVYTVEDASGKQYTQTVGVTVKAVSDAPVGYDKDSQVMDFVGAYTDDGTTRWRDDIKMSDFGVFTDSADKIQTFSNYNVGVANDLDTAKYIRLYGVSGGGYDGIIRYKGKELNFGGGKYYDVSISDIKAGRLELDFSKRYTTYKLKFAWVDSGTVDNNACYDGSVVSKSDYVSLITSPIALDLDGDGKIGVTGATGSSQKDADAELGRTVQFDIDADGKLDTIEWFDGSGDGILVDNRDGLAATQMDGARLFGDGDGLFDNGYDKLAALDTNADGQINGAELSGLALWVDNGDAQVQAGELRTLAEMGISAISSQMSVTVDAEGRGHLQSTATRADGSELLTEDVYFAHGKGDSDLPALNEVLGGAEAGLDALVGAGSADTTSAAMIQAVDVADVSQAADALRKIAAALAGEAVAA